MTVVDAIKVILSQASESMTAQEIYTQIVQQHLYQFAAKNPAHIVLTALRRHCQGLDFPTSSPMKHFQFGPSKRGKATYMLFNADTPSVQIPTQVKDKEKLPEEIIQSAHRAHMESVKTTLLEKILENDPSFFEHLVLKLLLGMGYGYTLDSGIVTGGPYDQGIDGVIFEDELQFNQIQFQAKRYAADHEVRSSELRGFVGSILANESGVDKGVFITTSHFSRNALQYAKKLEGNKKVALKLIDGWQLVGLMLKHKIGVTVSAPIYTYVVDIDYFNEA